MQIQYLVDLVGALLSANANAASQRRQARLPGVTVETVRTMKEAGMISALTNAAGLLDLDHPKVLTHSSAPRACVCVCVCVCAAECSGVGSSWFDCMPWLSAGGGSRLAVHALHMPSLSPCSALLQACRCTRTNQGLPDVWASCRADGDHDLQASEVVGALLKPLEILVRPLPARKPAEAAGQDRQGPQRIALGASQPPGGSAAPTGTAQQPPVGQPDPAAQVGTRSACALLRLVG